MSWSPDYPTTATASLYPPLLAPPAPKPHGLSWPYKFALWCLVINALVTNVTIWLIMDHVR